MSLVVVLGSALAMVLVALLMIRGDHWRPEPSFVLTMIVCLAFLGWDEWGKRRAKR